jgi:hypothetical protein
MQNANVGINLRNDEIQYATRIYDLSIEGGRSLKNESVICSERERNHPLAFS